jgi:hypothetical protein
MGNHQIKTRKLRPLLGSLPLALVVGQLTHAMA